MKRILPILLICSGAVSAIADELETLQSIETNTYFIAAGVAVLVGVQIFRYVSLRSSI